MTYTSHGHHIPGSPTDDEHGSNRMRCGGPAICTVCQRDAGLWARRIDPVTAAVPFEDTSGYADNPDRYLDKVKLLVVSAHNSHVEEEDFLTIDNLYIVSFTYILGGYKAMVSTNVSGDGLYFEVTHNATKEESYVDQYHKEFNDVFSQEGITHA